MWGKIREKISRKITPKHVLICRTDNLGDALLTLPMAALIKRYYPECRVSYLVKRYASELVKACPYVDSVIELEDLLESDPQFAVNDLRSKKIDTMIYVLPNRKVAKLGRMARIPYRIGTTRRVFHWWYCNRLVYVKRFRSLLHEAQLNLLLLKALHISPAVSIKELITLIKLEHIPVAEKVRAVFSEDRFNLILHPLSNGNGREWPIAKYIELIQRLPVSVHVVVAGGPSEKPLLQPLIDSCPGVTSVVGELTLRDYMSLIQIADGFIAASTGPLHIAAAFGVRTLGFFSPLREKSSTRWGPIGKCTYVLEKAACDKQQCCNRQCPCVDDISVERVLQSVVSWQQECVSCAGH